MSENGNILNGNSNIDNSNDTEINESIDLNSEGNDNIDKLYMVKTLLKIVIEPHSSVYAPVYISKECEVSNEFLVIKKINNPDLTMYDYLCTFDVPPKENENDDQNLNDVNSEGVLKNQKPSSSDQQLRNFTIFLQNDSDNVITLNKGQSVAYVESIEYVNEPEGNELNQNEQISDETVNLIVATEDVIQKRKDEFNIKDIDMQHLNPKQQNELSKLLAENFQAFSKSLITMGHTDRVEPRFTFTSDQPMKTLPFPCPYKIQPEVKKQIDELLSAGIISRSLSEWASPLVVVKKKVAEGEPPKFRLVLDLRLINSIIQPSSYPLPKIQDIITNVSQYKYYTTLDLQNAYHQIHMPQKHRDRFAFTSFYGLFSYSRLVFGLRTAASTFQALMDTIIAELNLAGIFAYQDDIVICANSFLEMLSKIRALLKLLIKYNITLSVAKCHFFKEEIDYLGFRISHNYISPVKANILKITSFSPPKTRKLLKRFVGVCGYYHHLVKGYSDLINPLVAMTAPSKPFKWTPECQAAFEKLQQIFFKEPFVRQPVLSEPFYLNTDASKVAISAILLQKFNGKLHPVSYYSKTLSKTQKSYAANKLELLAILLGIRAFKSFLYGRPIYLISDAKSLKNFRKTTSPADLITRWLLELSQYDIVFHHVSGSLNVLPDYFSRVDSELQQQNLKTHPELVHSNQILPVDHDIEDDLEYEINALNHSSVLPQPQNLTTIHNSCFGTPFTDSEFCNILDVVNDDTPDPTLEISDKTFLREQLKDKKLSPIYNFILNNPINEKYPNFAIHPVSKILIYIKSKPGTEPDPNETIHKIVVPTSLKAKVLKICHLTHFGIEKSYAFVSKKYFWNNIYTDTVNFVSSCATCMTSKPHNIPKAPFGNTVIPRRPGIYVTMDILGPFSNSKYILTIIDKFSKHIELYPLTSITADNVMEALFSYLTVHGRPAVILTDLGSQFTSQLFEKFNSKLGIKLNHTTVANPKSNSSSERINTSIKSTLTSLLSEGYNFENAIKLHQSLYNSSVHRTTEFAPNTVHFGRPLSLIFDTLQDQPITYQLDKERSLINIISDIESMYQKVYSNIKNAQDVQNTKQHAVAKVRNFNVNDIVYIKTIGKFKNRFDGPYVILEKCTDSVYSVQWFNSPSSKVFSIHCDKLILAPPRFDHLVENNVSSQNLFDNNNDCDSAKPSHGYFLRERNR